MVDSGESMNKSILTLACVILAFLVLFLSAYTPVTKAQQQYPITIVSVTTRDMQGNVKTEFVRGSMVVVDVTIKGESLIQYYYPQGLSYLLIVEIMKGNSVYYIGFVKDIISAGQNKSTGIGFTIPADAPTGTWTVKVLVWNDWIAIAGANWAALAEPKTTTFTVVPG